MNLSSEMLTKIVRISTKYVFIWVYFERKRKLKMHFSLETEDLKPKETR